MEFRLVLLLRCASSSGRFTQKGTRVPEEGLVGLMGRSGLLANDEVLDSNTESADRGHCVIVMRPTPPPVQWVPGPSQG